MKFYIAILCLLTANASLAQTAPSTPAQNSAAFNAGLDFGKQTANPKASGAINQTNLDNLGSTAQGQNNSLSTNPITLDLQAKFATSNAGNTGLGQDGQTQKDECANYQPVAANPTPEELAKNAYCAAVNDLAKVQNYKQKSGLSKSDGIFTNTTSAYAQGISNQGMLETTLNTGSGTTSSCVLVSSISPPVYTESQCTRAATLVGTPCNITIAPQTNVEAYCDISGSALATAPAQSSAPGYTWGRVDYGCQPTTVTDGAGNVIPNPMYSMGAKITFTDYITGGWSMPNLQVQYNTNGGPVTGSSMWVTGHDECYPCHWVEDYHYNRATFFYNGVDNTLYFQPSYSAGVSSVSNICAPEYTYRPSVSYSAGVMSCGNYAWTWDYGTYSLVYRFVELPKPQYDIGNGWCYAPDPIYGNYYYGQWTYSIVNTAPAYCTKATDSTSIPYRTNTGQCNIGFDFYPDPDLPQVCTTGYEWVLDPYYNSWNYVWVTTCVTPPQPNGMCSPSAYDSYLPTVENDRAIRHYFPLDPWTGSAGVKTTLTENKNDSCSSLKGQTATPGYAVVSGNTFICPSSPNLYDCLAPADPGNLAYQVTGTSACNAGFAYFPDPQTCSYSTNAPGVTNACPPSTGTCYKL